MNADREAIEALVVDNPDLEKLEALLGQFNIFEALQVVRQELRHSAFLAYLLDPAGNHGLGDEFARRLLQRCLLPVKMRPLPISPIDLDIWDLSGMVIRQEWQGIDILLLDEAHQLAVVIENKIDSSEHSNQLERYLQVTRQHYPGWKTLGLYLSPEGEEPSHEAYIAVDYLTVCKVIEQLLETRASTLGADIRTLMLHYAQMVRRHIVAESEIAELCKRIYRKHKRALDLIYEYRPDQQSTIREILEQLIQQSSDLLLDDCSKTRIRFVPVDWDTERLNSGSGWTRSGRILLFEFVNLVDSLKLKLYIGPGPHHLRQDLFDLARAHQPPFRVHSKALGEKWNSIYDKTYLTARDYEDATDEQISDEIRKHWRRFLDTDLPMISEVLRKEQWIQ